MVENLKVARYRDGDTIPNVTVNLGWRTQTTGKCCYYNNDSASCNSAAGLLYNWFAINDSGNIAPQGWHIPTDKDWATLTSYLTYTGYGYDGCGDDIAKSMASTSCWWADTVVGNPGNDQENNNSSGFAALPGGFRQAFGGFNYSDTVAMWWTSTEINTEGTLFIYMCCRMDQVRSSYIN